MIQEQLQKLYQESDIALAIDQLLAITEDNFTQNNFETVNTILEQIDFNQLNSILVEGLMRSTYRFQTSLPAWSSALQRAQDALRNRPENQYDLLAGLKSQI